MRVCVAVPAVLVVDAVALEVLGVDAAASAVAASVAVVVPNKGIIMR